MSNEQPGAFAVQPRRQVEIQEERLEARTGTASEFASMPFPNESPLIEAELADPDISSHIRRVLEESAVTGVATLDTSEKESAESRRGATESRRRQKLLIVIFCLILLALVVIIVIVVLLVKKEPPLTTTITIVIQLDHKPEETSWELSHGDNEIVAEAEPGTYEGKPNALVTVNPVVSVGAEHTFTIFDEGGDGIDEGSYKIYDAPDSSDPTTLLFEGSGNFTYESEYQFIPTGFVCPDECCDDSDCSTEGERCSTVESCMFHQCVQCFEDSHCERGGQVVSDDCDCNTGLCEMNE